MIHFGMGELGLVVGCRMDGLMGSGTRPCELNGKIGIIPLGNILFSYTHLKTLNSTLFILIQIYT